MKPYVFIDKAVPPDVEAYIAAHCRIGKWEPGETPGREALLAKLAQAEGLLTSGTGTVVDDELLASAPALRAVSTIGVGYNHFDVAALKRRGVLGTHTPHVLDETVADLVLALMLGAARRVAELDLYVKQGQWQKTDREKLYGTDVHHTTLGIIGLGRIGEAIARRAALGFSMEVLYYNRSRKPEAEEALGVKYRPLETLLQASDFVVVMLPLTGDTKHLIGEAELRLMKPDAIFVNASRGQTVDEDALVRALQEKRIKAAALDVYSQEPVAADHPLLRLPNVVTLPHIGSATFRTRHEMARLAARNLVAAVLGETPPHVISELK